MLSLTSATDVPIHRKPFNWPRIKVEIVNLKDVGQSEYKWSGPENYLALHDLVLSDGEIRVDGRENARLLDLRNLLTFLPPNVGVEGWGRYKARRNTIAVLNFDADLVQSERETHLRLGSAPPLIYFLDESLKTTMLKLHAIVSAGEPAAEMFAETLAILAALELSRKLGSQAETQLSAGGRLSNRHLAMTHDYIAAHLSRPILLSELAAIVGLSRFHFLRAFKKTFGVTPHQFLTQKRIEKAQRLLAETGVPISAIAADCGFGSLAHFSATFRRITSAPPSEYRRTIRGQEP